MGVPNISELQRNIEKFPVYVPPLETPPSFISSILWGTVGSCKNMAARCVISFALGSNSAHQQRLNELNAWLGTNQIGLIADTLSDKFEGKLPVFITKAHVKGMIVLALHSLVQRTFNRIGNNPKFSDILETLIDILQKRKSEIMTKGLEPLICDVFECLLPAEQLNLPGFITNYIYNRAIDSLATTENLLLYIEVNKAYENSENQEKMRKKDKDVHDKMESAIDPMVSFIHTNIKRNHELVSSQIFDLMGIKSDPLKKWWGRQFEVFVKGRQCEDCEKCEDFVQDDTKAFRTLVSIAAVFLKQTVSNILIHKGGERETTQELALDVLKEMMDFGLSVKNRNKLWNFDPKRTRQNLSLFRPLAKTFVKKLHLAEPGVMPKFLHERMIKFFQSQQSHLPEQAAKEMSEAKIVKFLEDQLSYLLVKSYETLVFKELRQLNVGLPEAVDPNIALFAENLGAYASHMVFNDLLKSEKGIKGASQSVAQFFTEWKSELAYVMPHSQAFWEKALIKLTKSPRNRSIAAQQMQSYVTHLVTVVLQKTLTQLEDFEADSEQNRELKRDFVAVVDCYVNERAPRVFQPGTRTRKEMLKGIVDAYRRILAVDPKMFPVPVEMQDSLWDFLPDHLDTHLAKFLEPNYLTNKLAKVVKGLDPKQGTGVEDNPIDDPVMDELCNKLVKDLITYMDLPFARYASKLGIRERGGYKLTIGILHKLIGKTLREQLNGKNWDLSKILLASLAAANKNEVFAINPPTVEEEYLDLASETVNKLDEVLEEIVKGYKRDLFASLKESLGDKAAEVISWLAYILVPIMWFCWLLKKILFVSLRNWLRSAIQKAQKTLDVSLIEGLVDRVNISVHPAGPELPVPGAL